MDTYLFALDHDWLKAANDAFDREFARDYREPQTTTEDDVRRMACDVCRPEGE